MAYNPYNDEYLKKSKKQGDQENYQLIQDYKNAYIEAEKRGDTKAMEEAHKGAEAVRATYGYTGGASGNAYSALTPNNKNSNPSFFGNAYSDIGKMQQEGFNAYKDVVETQKKGLIDSVSRGKTQINENYNNAYESLQKEQNKTLDKLPEDMAKLGLYGSGTGETAYAKIKEGYAIELKKLLSDKNKALGDIDNQIADLENQSATQIAQYYSDMMQKNPELYLNMLNNQYNEFNNNRNWEYQKERDKVSDNRYKTEVDYQKGRDAINDSRYATEYADNKNSEEYNKKLNEAKIAASHGNIQPLVDLGVLSAEDAAFNTNTPTVKTSSGGKSGGSSSGNKELMKSRVDTEISHWLYSPYNYDNSGYFYNGWNEDTNPQYAARDKINNPDVVRYIKDELIGAGYTATQANNIIEGYKKTIKEQINKIEGKETEDE